MRNLMILEQWFLTTIVEASANFQEGLEMTLMIQNKEKTNIKPKQQKNQDVLLSFILIHPFNICHRHKREPNFKRVTSTPLLNRKTSTLSEKKVQNLSLGKHPFKSYSFGPYLSLKGTYWYVKCTY